MEKQSGFMRFITRGSLVGQILVGLVLGILLASIAPNAAIEVGLLGSLFVSALKAVAPILVFVLVAASIANHKQVSAPICVRFCSFTCWAPSLPHW